MDRTGLLLELDELLEVPAGTLTGTEKLDDLENWNSVAMVSFIAVVDQHFEYTVSPRDFRTCITINDLIGLVKPLQA